ncbi:MAG TPA: lamin tail domain-containing protein, partial [Candidatus Limnocylindria bacterium]|nr:lamin tail domain-containing protein [Candidatus Limnocylindria bacterium]
MKQFLSLSFLVASLLAVRADSVVVFNEIMYHPQTSETTLEWVELCNQMAVDVELSGWSIRGGIDYDFPEGAVIPGRGYLLVALSPATMTAITGGTNVVGPFSGRLSNSGEEIRLRNNNGRVVDAVEYGVEGDWPVAPDGAGPSLAKFDEDSASATPTSWRASSRVGGTPGDANQPRVLLTTTMRTLVPINQTWRYDQSGAELGLAWRTTNYNDSTWASGPALLADETCNCLPEAIGTGLTVSAQKTNFYFRTAFNFTGNLANVSLSLRHVVDDGLIVYLNGAEVWRLGMPTGAVDSATLSSRSVDNAVYEGSFAIPSTSLVLGTNVLAVEVHQQAAASTDIVFGLQLDDSTTVTNAPSQTSVAPVQLAFNEMSSVTNAQFWVEIVNSSTQSVALDNFVLARFGTTNREYVIPAQTIPSGGYLVLDRATIGFGADPGDQVVLYGPGKTNVFDSVLAKSFLRGRYPDATGAWLRPSLATPGTTNVFAFHDEIVINEILYQGRPLPAIPAVYFTNVLLTMTNGWRYDQTGITNISPLWTAADYDDSLWPTGRAVFYTNITTLPAPKGTTLQLTNISSSATQSITTYYFRTPFEFTNSLAGLQLTLNHLTDDGAIFYLNGVEVFRYSLPTGTVVAATRALTNIGVPVIAGPITIPTSSLIVGTNILAVELHQYLPPPGSRDIAFAMELTAVGLISPSFPSRESPESWIELFNRGSNAVDLTGWRLDDGIDFHFNGTTIPAGGYLIVAKDVTFMQEKYPGVNVVGPFTNSLARGSDHIELKDAFENPADEVRYHDSRPWPDYANGSGSSIELRDPRADNSKPEAWAASDQSGPSQWQTYAYRGIAALEPAASPTQWNEFVMGLLGEGEVLLDDISVLENPTGTRRQMLQNGTFETGLNAWRTIGTHRQSQVIVDPANAANKVLRLVATGDTEHRHNQASTTLTNGLAIVNGNEYEISFKAKWIAGNNKLNTRLYFNRLTRTTLLQVPEAHGTPGAVNSRFIANAGPTFSNLRHTPIVPANNESVTISAESSDLDGVASAQLFYSVNGGAWQTTAMTISNQPASLLLRGTIPPQSAASLVQFYIRATDGLGATAMYPAAGTNSRALYRVGNNQALMARLHNVRLLMTASDVASMHAPTNVMSNEPWGVTVIYDDREVFYDTTLHLQASERGRNDSTRVGFTVKLPADHLLRGVNGGFTLDRSGGYSGLGGKHDEILIKHAVNKARGLPCMYDDIVQVFAPRSSEDGTALLLTAKYEGDFLDSAFQDGGAGEMYKLELIYYPTTTSVAGDPQAPKLPQPDGVVGTDIRDLGNNPDDYRWVFLKENHVARDNYDPMMGLAKAMNQTGAAFDAQIQNVMDVDEWLRAGAFLAIIGGNDIYTYGNSHNLIIYFRPEDQKAMAFLWDMDFSFVAAVNAPFPGTGSPNTSKLFANPDNNRRYYNHLYDLTAVTGDAAYMTRWANHYAGLLGQNWASAVNFLVQRAAYVRSVMPLATPFVISNNGGNDFATTDSSVVLTGTSPMSVRDIEINGIRYGLTWTSLTDWRLTLPLPANVNLVQVKGVDADGNYLTNAIDSITITNAGVSAAVSVVINEWMADDAGPGGFSDPLDGLFQDWFELYNPNDVPVNLSGYYLTDTLANPQ